MHEYCAFETWNRIQMCAEKQKIGFWENLGYEFIVKDTRQHAVWIADSVRDEDKTEM